MYRQLFPGIPGFGSQPGGCKWKCSKAIIIEDQLSESALAWQSQSEVLVGRSRTFLAHRKRGAGPSVRVLIALLEDALRAVSKLARLLSGRPPRHACWKTAAECKFIPVEPAVGWAADDAIAALCRLLASTLLPSLCKPLGFGFFQRQLNANPKNCYHLFI